MAIFPNLSMSPVREATRLAWVIAASQAPGTRLGSQKVLKPVC